jgi:hypothetical protein
MARHPEVSEKSLIQGGLELEKLGKSPNPGSIRAHLGYRVGLMRIKSVWDSFTQKRNQELLPECSTELSFDALLDDYANNATQLMERKLLSENSLLLERISVFEEKFDKQLLQHLTDKEFVCFTPFATLYL